MTLRRAAFLLVLSLACPPLAGAQDDPDLANALAERGWYDLAEEMFLRVQKSTGATPDQRGEGEYGMARIKILMADRAESSAEKEKLCNDAIATLQKFLDQHATHRRRGEALSDIGYLYQTKGKSLIALAKVDPAQMQAAEKAFATAEKLSTDLIEQLRKDVRTRPDPDEKKKNPDKFGADMKAFEQWEERMMYAKYNYAVTLFTHAEAFRDVPAKHADMKKILEDMIAFLNKEFMWEYEWYLLAYDAFIYMGRAYQVMAEISDREKSEEHWRNCFNYIGKAKGLRSDPNARKNDAVREISSRALLYEMKARLAYGDTRSAAGAAAIYLEAARQADDLFRDYPNLPKEDIGKAIQLEQARAFCKGGKLDKGLQVLQGLAKSGKDTWVESVAMDMLGEYGGIRSVPLAIDAADNTFERGPAFLYRAMQMYRKILANIKKPEDEKFRPYCWYQIGRSYYYINRYYEAAAAFSQLEDTAFAAAKEAPEAAKLKLFTLDRLAKITGDKADQAALDAWRKDVTRKWPDVMGDQILRQEATEAEIKQRFLDAVAAWEKLIRPGKDEANEEGYFRIGYNLYREGNRVLEQEGKESRERAVAKAAELWKRAQASFKKHLDVVGKLPTKSATALNNAIGSIFFSMKILTHPAVNLPQEALAMSEDVEKRFPAADSKYIIAILSFRLQAKVDLGKTEEAEVELLQLKAKYDKERLGLDYYMNALKALAGAFELLADKVKDADPDRYDVCSRKAADYYYQYYLLNPGAVTRPEQMEGMADRLFTAAEQRTQEEKTEEAKEIYQKALDLYKEFLRLQEKDMDEDHKRSVQARITRCLLKAGHFAEAISTFEILTKADPDMRDGATWEGLADCYVEKAKALPRGPDRTMVFRQAERIYSDIATRLQRNMKQNEHYWRLLLKRAEALYEVDVDQLRQFFEVFTARGYCPKWDADDSGKSQWGFQPKFEELRQKVQAAVPPTNK